MTRIAPAGMVGDVEFGGVVERAPTGGGVVLKLDDAAGDVGVEVSAVVGGGEGTVGEDVGEVGEDVTGLDGVGAAGDGARAETGGDGDGDEGAACG